MSRVEIFQDPFRYDTNFPINVVTFATCLQKCYDTNRNIIDTDLKKNTTRSFPPAIHQIKPEFRRGIRVVVTTRRALDEQQGRAIVI